MGDNAYIYTLNISPLLSPATASFPYSVRRFHTAVLFQRCDVSRCRGITVFLLEPRTEPMNIFRSNH